MASLTVDHNVGTELVREGLIAPEDLARHPQRNMLTRALGAAVDVRPDLFALDLAADDVFLLMTDGMLEAVTEEEALATAGQGGANWSRVGPALADLAASRRNGDDATVVAVRVSPRTEGRS